MIDTIPFNETLEREVLGAMVFDPECIQAVVDLRIIPDDFYFQSHKLICREIFRLWNQDVRLVNLVEMQPFLTENNIEISYLTGLATNLVAAASIEYHAERLKSIAYLRKMVLAGAEIASWGSLHNREEIQDAINKAEDMIARITDEAVPATTLVSLPDALAQFQVVFDEAYKNKKAVVGVPSGFPDLDLLTTGFKEQDLVILAARTSLGKTAFAVQLALNMMKAKKKGVFFELEMNQHSVLSRVVANMSGIDSNDLITGFVTPEEKELVDNTIATMSLASEGFHLDTAPNMSLFEMKAKARKLKRRGELDFIIVDYLQLISVPQQGSRFDDVSFISRQLKMMARELNVPIIALSQLSRAVEQRQDKRPMLSDLRESGSIEQDADTVLFLYRDDYYNPDSEKKGITEVIVAKQRNGALGKAELLFVKEKSKFLSLELPAKREEKAPLAMKESAATTTTTEEVDF